jgi:NADH-quinone oxidoreductase subunit M
MVLWALILLPVLAALAALGTGRPLRAGGALALLGPLLLVILLVSGEDGAVQAPWIPELGLTLRLEMNGISLLLVALGPVMTAMALLLTPENTPRAGEYTFWMLLLLAGLQGVFLADNLGLFYVFWEVMLIPAWLLVGRWGGDEGRRASLKFVLYTLAGSLVMLLGIVGLACWQTGLGLPLDLDFDELRWLGLPPSAQTALLLCFALGFAVKVPLVPLHGWLADTYETPPAPVAGVVSAVMSKAGVFGFLKVCLPLFPAGMQHFAGLLAFLAVLTILYGALCALGAGRMRRIVAYSSLSHMGMMMLGVATLQPAGLEGAALQMFTHGITTGGLFLLLGLLESRGLPGELESTGGLARPMPRLAAVFMLLAMGTLGLPGLSSFPGELLILWGTWQSYPALAVLAGLGVVAAGWYTVRLYQFSMHGPLREPAPPARVPPDMASGEVAALVPVLVLVIGIGVWPGPWVELTRPVVGALLGGLP